MRRQRGYKVEERWEERSRQSEGVPVERRRPLESGRRVAWVEGVEREREWEGRRRVRVEFLRERVRM